MQSIVQLAGVTKADESLQESQFSEDTARWKGAVGNIEDARVAANTLARAIQDAVYLDEDAYSQVAPIMQYQNNTQVRRTYSAQLRT